MRSLRLDRTPRRWQACDLPEVRGMGGVSAVRVSALEALINAAVGLCVSWAATYWLLPLWGLHPSLSASGGITAMFFCLSMARAFVIREVFRRWG